MEIHRTIHLVDIKQGQTVYKTVTGRQTQDYPTLFDESDPAELAELSYPKNGQKLSHVIYICLFYIQYLLNLSSFNLKLCKEFFSQPKLDIFRGV